MSWRTGKADDHTAAVSWAQRLYEGAESVVNS